MNRLTTRGMGSITRLIFGSSQAKTATMFTPCIPKKGSHTVAIKIFDRKSVLGDSGLNEQDLKQQLEAFFRSMASTPDILPAVKQLLEAFTFVVTVFDRDSTKAEREGFTVMDFPIYLESTLGPSGLTGGSAADLLEAHKIPSQAFVALQLTDTIDPVTLLIGNPQEDRPVYKAAEEFVTDNTALGFGIPGNYLKPDGIQHICRKLGIIKMDRVVFLIPQAKRPRRLLHVLKHEMGHMLGLAHVDGTMMDHKYVNTENFEMYSRLQLQLISTTLTNMSTS